MVEPNVRRLGVNAAVCHYHYHQDLDEGTFIQEAMDFAYGDYANALLHKQNLRFSELDFITGLCPGEFISMYDARMTLPIEGDGGASGNQATVDIVIPDEDKEPFMSCVGTSISACMKQYSDEELARPEGRVYQDDTMAIGLRWDYAGYQKDTLRLPEELLKEKKELRMLFVNGRYDLSSTFDFMTYYLSQYDLPEDRISVKVLESGHASYIGDGNAAALSQIVRDFITENK